MGRRARARLVVLAVEVGGRWSEEARSFLSQLAKARARGENKLLSKRAEQAWRFRWGSLLACTGARAVAMSLLELPVGLMEQLFLLMSEGDFRDAVPA